VRTTRRGFLSLAGSSAAFAALAQVRFGAAAAAAEAPQAGASFFSAGEREVLEQIVARVCDTGEPDAPALADTDTIATIESLCAGLDPAITAPLGPLLRAFEWAPWIFDFTFTRFTRMSPEQQDASLRAWMTSRIGLRRQAFYALRNLAFVGWYSQPGTWPLIGYAGPLLGDRGAVGGGAAGKRAP